MASQCNKIKFYVFVIVLGLTHFCGAQQERPNILVILCDDLGYSDVGFNGSTDIITPEVDKLAQNGAVFTSAYVAHPFCGPSRSALLTGRYPHLLGTGYNLVHNSSQDDKDNMGVPLSETYISKLLQDAGYFTGVVGKWHQLKAGKKEIVDYLHPLEHNGKPVKETEYLTDAFTREAIREIKTATDKKIPFFIFLSYNAPHVPLQAKTEDLQKYMGIKDENRRTYAAMVSAIDRGVGQVVKTLKETEQFHNTLIVFLSDNGGNSDNGANNYPLKGIKGDTWEGGYRVPMLFHWPQKIAKGKRIDFPVSALDLYPTFVSLANTNVPKDKKLSGQDIMDAVLTGTDKNLKNRMIYALRYRMGYCDVGGRQGNWKITRMANDPWRLYNVSDDIGEKKDLSRKYPERLKKMIAKTAEWTKGFVRPLWFFSLRDEELWDSGEMPRYDQTFEIERLLLPPTKK